MALGTITIVLIIFLL